MYSTSVIWARVALGVYMAGFATSLVAWRRGRPAAVTRGLVAAAFLFQFVSLAEVAFGFSQSPIGLYRELTALLALIIAGFFLAVYRPDSRPLGLLVLPLVCLLSLVAAFAPPAEVAAAPGAENLLQSGWIVVHVVLIALGYAFLVLAVAASVVYLAAERALKSKQAPARRRWPALETLDRIGYRALMIGFPLLTCGLAIGGWVAARRLGGVAFSDPTVYLAVLAWCVYIVLLNARWWAGWRGRRTAYLALVCFGLALAGWFANGFSTMHSLLQ